MSPENENTIDDVLGALEKLSGEVGSVKDELHSVKDELRTEMAHSHDKLRNELAAEIRDLRNDYEGLRMGHYAAQSIRGGRGIPLQSLEPATHSTVPQEYEVKGYRRLIPKE